MVELFEQDIRDEGRLSSKGNQLKWVNDGMWYKADYTGYEGLSEYIVSKLLKKSSLQADEYVDYDTEQMHYKYSTYLGCRSASFLPKGWMLITLERLFQSAYNHSLNKAVYSMEDCEQRIRFIVEQTIRLTGLVDFGAYMSRLMTIDALFLNEDRHTHNIAVLMDTDRKFHYCPIFDNGAALLSDTTVDYPMHVDVYRLFGNAKAKTFSRDFDEQLDIAEKLYGQQLSFDFTYGDVKKLLEEEPYYPEKVKKRVEDIIMHQRRKYEYLFKCSGN